MLTIGGTRWSTFGDVPSLALQSVFPRPSRVFSSYGPEPDGG